MTKYIFDYMVPALLINNLVSDGLSVVLHGLDSGVSPFFFHFRAARSDKITPQRGISVIQ
jgi:hypothetical protein